MQGDINMKKRVVNLKILIPAIVLCMVCGGCGGRDEVVDGSWDKRSAGEEAADERMGISEETQEDDGMDSDSEAENEEDTSAGEAELTPLLSSRPTLLGEDANNSESRIEPDAEPYTIHPGLSNVENVWQFSLVEEITEKLEQNGFAVGGNAGNEFFEIYELNRYKMIPSFVTVDSMMHTYHLYFSYLMKKIEKDRLAEQLEQLSRRMLDNSEAQYELLKGSEWETAAARNLAFFAVGASLQDENTEIHGDVAGMVHNELDNIRQAKEIRESALTGSMEDYTQYIPRGYYEGDEVLEQYFRAMMWYGRMHFRQEEEDLDRSALLMTLAISGDVEASGLWEGIYAVTSFFTGASDDSGVCEYRAVMEQVYGQELTAENLIGDTEGFARFHKLTEEVPVPQVNSVPIRDGEGNAIPGFRFMGQRFTIDAAIMQQLIYSNVEENSRGSRRMLPDVLDVPAALGSDTALEILRENGAGEYAGYLDNMEWLRKSLSMENTAMWSASLYAGWLNTLRPLLEKKGEGYPIFMQSEEWRKKNLECFAGSFTELKHDTILYAKQVIAEMGGEYDERQPDDRGYVEPEPLVYCRFANLARMTLKGLEEYDMLSSEDEEKLSVLAEFAQRLQTISEKELRNEVLSAEEYDFIKGYGGSIEHFWREAVQSDSGEEWISTQEYPAAMVVDIATDPNGAVLEAATGDPCQIFVVVQVDGALKIARGSVYSFYQFPWPLEDRLTDTKWREMMGLQADEEGYYHDDKPVDKPAWTESYRYDSEWN